MRKNLFQLVLSLVFCFSISVSGQVKNTTKPEISKDSVETLLYFLASDELAGRATGTAGIEEAARQIETIFSENGIEPYYKTYRDSFEVQGKTAYNIVGLLEGSDPELKDQYVILGAHYDHIGEGEEVAGDFIANGANDNAAGTVAVVELAKHFAKVKDNKRSMLFILFSAEEMGLQGSKHNAEKLKAEGIDLYAMVNLEMIGTPMQGKDYLAYLTGYKRSNLAEKFNEYAGSQVLGFLPQAQEYNLFRRSDNYPYYEEFNVPAQTISTFDFTNYEFYHHVSDEADRLDIEHMTNVIEEIIPGIAGMVNFEEKEIKLNE